MEMTTDERLDRLAERHGALAESLQLLTADVHGLTAKQYDQVLTEHDRILRGRADLIGDLARIASAHEQCVQRLESRQG